MILYVENWRNWIVYNGEGGGASGKGPRPFPTQWDLCIAKTFHSAPHSFVPSTSALLQNEAKSYLDADEANSQGDAVMHGSFLQGIHDLILISNCVFLRDHRPSSRVQKLARSGTTQKLIRNQLQPITWNRLTDSTCKVSLN